VLEDVLDRKVLLEEAREVYGVVIDTTTWTVDPELTAQRRAELAAARGPIAEMYDRGGRGIKLKVEDMGRGKRIVAPDPSPPPPRADKGRY
jgi:hypothetical protein